MKLLLSNYRSECDPREITVPGNPLLTYNAFRAGDGVLGARETGSTAAIFSYDVTRDVWLYREDQTEWTDIEVVGMDTGTLSGRWGLQDWTDGTDVTPEEPRKSWLTVTLDGEEAAVLVHRDTSHPLDAEWKAEKERLARYIVDSLNRPRLSEPEAQELHELIGAAVETTTALADYEGQGRWTAEDSAVIDGLRRAREIAAMLLSDSRPGDA